MKPPADWMAMPRAFTDLIPSVPSIALIVPKSLHGFVVLYACNALSGTIKVQFLMFTPLKISILVLGTFFAKHVTVSILLQSAKAPNSIFSTPDPIVIEERPLQNPKAFCSILVTEFGIITDVKPLQP